MATLPDALSDYVLAAAQLAAAAVARGDRAEARRLLESALQAVEQKGTDGAQVLRIVRGGE